MSADGATSALPKKRRGVIRRLFWYTTGLTGTFYVGSTFAAFYNQAYYDFFSDNVPLGQPMLEFAEANNWDTLTAAQVLDSGKKAAVSVQHFVTEKISGFGSHEPPKPRVEPKVKTIETVIVSKPVEVPAEVSKPTDAPKSQITKAVEKAKEKVHQVEDVMTGKTASPAKHQAEQDVEGLSKLVREAEEALRPSHVDSPPTSAPAPSEPAPSPEEVIAVPEAASKPVYNGPIPIGFELPPGFIRPAPPKEKPKNTESAPLPLIAPNVSSIGVSEPIIAQLASTIDNLASFVSADPAAATKAADVLESAKADLTALRDRIEKSKEDERVALESKMDEQAREYTQKLLELEMEAQDKLDSQEDGFRKLFDQERQRLVQAYHEKLHNELQIQTELINER